MSCDISMNPDCKIENGTVGPCIIADHLAAKGKTKESCSFWRKTNREAAGGTIWHDPMSWHGPIENIRTRVEQAACMMSVPNTQEAIAIACDEIKNFLLRKNSEYGDSAINPKRIFSDADPIEQINVRIDDKLSRIANRKEKTITEDTELDLIGYLILKRVALRRIGGWDGK